MTQPMEGRVRIERDTLGEVEVPADCYWGAQTQRSILHFPFGPRERMPDEIIAALAMVKLAAVRVNRDHGLDPVLATAIERAAEEVLAGDLADQFPLAIWQTGSGTHTNMNLNEVIAGRANEILTGKRGGKTPVHPNDHVNLGQSSNDSFPTALHIAVLRAGRCGLLPALGRLERRLNQEATDWAELVKVGRTHLQDAAPVTLGQEFDAWGFQLRQCRIRISTLFEDDLCAIAQGATAVGTGLNAPPDFPLRMAEALAEISGFPLRPAENLLAAIAQHDPLLRLSSELTILAAGLNKLGGDLRLLASGPDCGIGELILPSNEPGSSLMPGKVNPSQIEMLAMVAAQVIGNHHAVILGGLQGQLELNVFKPLLGHAVLRSLDLIATGVDAFTRFCIDGIAADEERITALLERNLMGVAALVPIIGYDKAAEIAQLARERRVTLRAAALLAGYIDAAYFDQVMDSSTMV